MFSIIANTYALGVVDEETNTSFKNIIIVFQGNDPNSEQVRILKQLKDKQQDILQPFFP